MGTSEIATRAEGPSDGFSWLDESLEVSGGKRSWAMRVELVSVGKDVKEEGGSRECVRKETELTC